MFSYLAILDYHHLDNGMFLNAFSQAITRHGESRGIVIHGDSQYTERIMQTGVMREEARIRSIRDLNNRLVALFADNGVSCIGLNGYQRELITVDEQEEISVDTNYINTLPKTPLLLLSNLAYERASGSFRALGLGELASALQKQLNLDASIAFTLDDRKEIFAQREQIEHKEWNNIDKEFLSNLPEEIQQPKRPIYITTTNGFGEIPNLKKATLLNN